MPASIRGASRRRIPFLIAAEQLNVPAADCLVFEDAELGIQSAEAAGMQWVKIAGPLERV